MLFVPCEIGVDSGSRAARASLKREVFELRPLPRLLVESGCVSFRRGLSSLARAVVSRLSSRGVVRAKVRILFMTWPESWKGDGGQRQVLS